VELTGTLSNPLVKVELQRLVAVCREIAREHAGNKPPAVPVEPPPKQPPVIRTVIKILRQAGRSMRAKEIHLAVEQGISQGVSWSTVKNALADEVAKPAGRVERVGYGRYRMKD
jgi:hypothetical protein